MRITRRATDFCSKESWEVVTLHDRSFKIAEAYEAGGTKVRGKNRVNASHVSLLQCPATWKAGEVESTGEANREAVSLGDQPSYRERK